ncbi:MAG: iron ABC transporter permease [Congregibacter sp.]
MNQAAGRVSVTPMLVILSLSLLAIAVVSLTRGPMHVPAIPSLLAIGDALLGRDWSSLETYQRAVVVELRLPRTLLAVFVGALLAQCGAVMQGLFRNPLADPGIVGVSAGAAVGAVLAIFIAPAEMSWWSVPLGAFSGGFLSSLLVYALARGPMGTSVLVLLLAGVAIAAIAGSVIGLASYLTDDERLRDIMLWQMGSLAAADSSRLLLVAAVFVLLALRFQYRASALNALLLGESEARHLGINVESLKFELVVLVAAGVGVAVAACGIIGFVGLIVPHALRMLCGPRFQVLLPLCALGGAVLLLAADAASRLALAPAELPVGIVTSLIGGPFFIFLLLRLRGRVL